MIAKVFQLMIVLGLMYGYVALSYHSLFVTPAEAAIYCDYGSINNPCKGG